MNMTYFYVLASQRIRITSHSTVPGTRLRMGSSSSEQVIYVLLCPLNRLPCLAGWGGRTVGRAVVVVWATPC